MPIARFKLEDGRVARFQVPDGTTPEAASQMANQYFSDEGAPAPEPAAPAEPGYFDAITSGLASNLRSAAKTKEALTGGKPTVDETDTKNPAAQGMEFKDLLHPGTLLKKGLYTLAASAPEMAAFGLGSAATAAIPGVGETGIGELVGGSLAAGAVSAAKELGPHYAEALKEHPDDPDAAMDLALKKAAASGATTGAMFGLFGLTPFKKQVSNLLSKAYLNNVPKALTGDEITAQVLRGVKNPVPKATAAETAAHLLTQSIGVQPAIAALGGATQNAIDGKHLSDGLTEGYAQSVLGTIVPLAGTHLAGKAVKRVWEGKNREEEEAPPPPDTEEAPPPPPLPPNTPAPINPEGASAPLPTPEAVAVAPAVDISDTVAEQPSADAEALNRDFPIVPKAVEAAPAPTGIPQELQDFIKSGVKHRIPREAGVREVLYGEPPPVLTGKSAAWKMAYEAGKENADIYKAKAPEAPKVETPKAEAVTPVETAPAAELPPHAVKSLDILNKLAFEAREDVAKTHEEGDVNKIDDLNNRVSAHTQVVIDEVKELKNRQLQSKNLKGDVPINEDTAAGKPAEEASRPVGNDVQWMTRDAVDEIKRGNFDEALQQLENLKRVADDGDYAKEGAKFNPREENRSFARFKDDTRQEPAARFPGAEQPALKGKQTDRGTSVPLVEPTKTYTKRTAKTVVTKLLTAGKITESNAQMAFDRLDAGHPPSNLVAYVRAIAVHNETRKPVTTKTLSEQGQYRSLQKSGEAPKPEDLSGSELTQGVFSDELEPQRQEVHAELTRRLRSLGLGDVALVIADRILHPSAKIFGQAAHDVIAVALDSADRLGTLNHEIVHSMRALGLFSSPEWAVLSRRAEGEWIKKYEIEKKYPELDRAGHIEEAIAEAFADAHRGKLPDGFLARSLARVKNVLRAIKEAFANRGFDTPDKIFRKVESGEIGARERQIRGEDAQVKYQKAPPDKMPDEIGKSYKYNRNTKDAIDQFKSAWEAISVGGLRKALYTFTTSDLAKIVGNRIPAVGRIAEAVRAKEETRRTLINNMSKTMDQWSKLFQENPKLGKKFGDLVNKSTFYQVDVRVHDTLQKAIDRNPKLGYKIAISDTKAWDARVAEIREVYNTFEELRKNDSNKGRAEGKGEGGWTDLYSQVLESYKNAFNAHFDQLRQNVKDLKYTDKADEKAALDMIDDLHKRASVFDVYAPLMRFGKYWMRVGDVNDGGSYHMFESARERNFALRKIKEQNPGIDTDAGDSFRKLRDKVGDSDGVVKDIFDMLNEKVNHLGEADRNELKDKVLQLYLSSLPGSDIRKSMMHRRNIPGFSPDARRVFAAHGVTNANQASRLKHEHLVRAEVSNGFATIKPDKADAEQRPTQELLKLRAYMEHVSKVVDKEFSYQSPDDIGLDRMAALGNKAVFYYMLSAPKSALVQMTQLPIVGMPILMARHGVYNTIKTAAKFSNILNSLAPRGTDTDALKWKQPSVVNSSMFKKMSQAMKDGYADAAREYDLFMGTRANDMTGIARSYTDDQMGPFNKAFHKTLDIMSGSFHHMERMSREIMFGSSLELELDKMVKGSKGEFKDHDALTPEMKKEAYKKAIDQTYEALFDYSTYNKPLLMKQGPIYKTATQFMTFPVNMASYLLRNGYSTLRNIKDPALRNAAATKFFGTMGMTWLFAGAVGMPLYSVGMGLMDALNNEFGLFGDDDEFFTDEDGNPLGKKSMDLWFREKFLPSMFGKGSGFQQALGLSDNMADMAQRSAKMGPISALTGWDIGASASLNDMFFHDDISTASAQNALSQFAYNRFFGAFGSMVAQGASGYEDIQNGKWMRGMEKLSPAFLRGPMRAYRFAEEGNLTPQGDEVRNAEWYTTGRLFQTGLGFGETEVDEIQKKNFLAKKIVAEMQKERQKVLDRFTAANTSGDEGDIDSAWDRVEHYNDRNLALPITSHTLITALKNRNKRAASAMEGLEVPNNLTPYFSDIISQSAVDLE